MARFPRFFVLVCLFWLGGVFGARAGDIDLLAEFNDIYWMQPVAETPAAAPQGCTAEDPPGMTAFPPDSITAFAGKRAAIAIVIDDVGLDRRRSARALDLPAAVTLAFLPYSPDIKAQAAAAAAKGHELMVHLPMAPEGMRVNPGPNYLAPEHAPEELDARIEANLGAFSGYAGVNNHMGSAFTKHRPGMDRLMTALAARDVYFLDSKTAPDSVAEAAARAAGIPATHRDVFLDHYEDAAHVQAALRQVEHIARVTGAVVAIGHPKDVTLDALAQWLPTLKAKGFDLVPLSTLIEIRARRNAPHSVKRDAPQTVKRDAPQTVKSAVPHAVKGNAPSVTPVVTFNR